MKIGPQIFIFVALPCEAKPLLAHFDLKKQLDHRVFSIYQKHNYYLTVTGVGKTAMAAGMAYTLALYADQSFPILLNVGIAGHGSSQIKDIYLAEKIYDADSDKRYYPQFVFQAPCMTSMITTVSQPQSAYKLSSLYDMEASAFYETAVKFSSSELIHSMKIISDNENSPVHAMNSKQVTEWMQHCTRTLDEVIACLAPLAQTVCTIPPDCLSEFLHKWHFTVAGKQKLQRLLMRWQVLSEGTKPVLDETRLKSGKDVLRDLEQAIAKLEISL